jgi:formylglycine-generating enzyme required for sulfatase activity
MSYTQLLCLAAGITLLMLSNGCKKDNPAGPSNNSEPHESSDMVLIPAGPYQMGASYFSAIGDPSELPIHTVNVPAFYMDRHEVTNAQYKIFCDSTSRAYPLDPNNFTGMPNYFTNPTYANYPVVNVSWEDASAYAAWAGKRLPTEAEWERAAKGNVDTLDYPWGNTWVAANANIFYDVWEDGDGYDYTSPVGHYSNGISPAGCYDMAGNVAEWCQDDGHMSYTGAPIDGSAWMDNPRSSFRVCRGGSWNSDHLHGEYGCLEVRCANRSYNDLTLRMSSLGFRCAKTP